MVQSKPHGGKTRKPGKGVKTGKSNDQTNKARKPGDVALSEKELSKVTGGGAINGVLPARQEC